MPAHVAALIRVGNTIVSLAGFCCCSSLSSVPVTMNFVRLYCWSNSMMGLVNDSDMLHSRHVKSGVNPDSKQSACNCLNTMSSHDSVLAVAG